MASKTYMKYKELANLVCDPSLDRFDIGEEVEAKVHEFLNNCAKPWDDAHMSWVTIDLVDTFFEGGLEELTEYMVFLDWLIRGQCKEHLQEFESYIRRCCALCLNDR